jgi:hypothetical protein
MRAHRHSPAVDHLVREFQDPLWSISQHGRHWPLWVRAMARLRAPWLDAALAAGADPSSSAMLERRAAHLLSRDHRARVVGSLRLSRATADAPIAMGDPRIPVEAEEVRLAMGQMVELEDLLISPAPVYCQGVAMASQIVSEGTGPLYAPRHRGELRERVTKVLAALRGAS